MRTQTFIVMGDPKGKGRPKFTTVNGWPRAYTPKTTIDYENSVKASFLSNHRKVFTDEPIMIQIDAFLSIPKNWSKKKRAQAIENNIFPTKKPDIDNIQKIILDALNGVAFDDDKQIIGVATTKRFSETPRVEVSISEVI